jgi:hypothetical protein
LHAASLPAPCDSGGLGSRTAGIAHSSLDVGALRRLPDLRAVFDQLFDGKIGAIKRRVGILKRLNVCSD